MAFPNVTNILSEVVQVPTAGSRFFGLLKRFLACAIVCMSVFAIVIFSLEKIFLTLDIGEIAKRVNITLLKN